MTPAIYRENYDSLIGDPNNDYAVCIILEIQTVPFRIRSRSLFLSFCPAPFISTAYLHLSPLSPEYIPPPTQLKIIIVIWKKSKCLSWRSPPDDTRVIALFLPCRRFRIELQSLSDVLTATTYQFAGLKDHKPRMHRHLLGWSPEKAHVLLCAKIHRSDYRNAGVTVC